MLSQDVGGEKTPSVICGSDGSCRADDDVISPESDALTGFIKR